MEQEIANQGAPRGRLRVSAALSHGRLCVVPLLGDFVQRYPLILVDIGLTDALVDVTAGQADVAIRFGPLADSPLTARKIGETRRVIVASPDYLARQGAPAGTGRPARLQLPQLQLPPCRADWPFRKDGRD